MAFGAPDLAAIVLFPEVNMTGNLTLCSEGAYFEAHPTPAYCPCPSGLEDEKR